MVVDFRNTPASVPADFKLYYSDAHVDGDVDPNALITVGERLDTSGLYTHEEMDAVADAFLSVLTGEVIAKALSPIKSRWNGRWRQAVLSKDTKRKEELEAFRADVLGYATPGSSSVRSSTIRTRSCTAARSSQPCWAATSTPTVTTATTASSRECSSPASS